MSDSSVFVNFCGLQALNTVSGEPHTNLDAGDYYCILNAHVLLYDETWLRMTSVILDCHRTSAALPVNGAPGLVNSEACVYLHRLSRIYGCPASAVFGTD